MGARVQRVILVLAMASLLILPVAAVARTTTPAPAEGEEAAGGTSRSVGLEEAAEAAGEESGITSVNRLSVLVGNVVNAILGIVGVVFFVLMIYAGLLWMMAQGNEEQITKAKNIFVTSVIGLVIIVGAYYILDFVINAIYTSLGA